jgi:predicted site-specific integrase-resolvase
MMNPRIVDDVSLMTVGKVAGLFHIHPSTLRRWSDQGVIRSFRMNSCGERRYRRFDVYHLLAELRAHNWKRKERISKGYIASTPNVLKCKTN